MKMLERYKRIGKKAAVEEIAETGTAIIIVVIMLLLMLLFANFVANNKEQQGAELLKEAKEAYIVSLFLKEEIIYQEQKISVSDLLTIIANQPNNARTESVNELSKVARNFFSTSSFSEQYTGVFISINDVSIFEDYNEGFIQWGTVLKNYKKTQAASFILPSKSNEPARIIIYFQEADYSVPEKSLQNAKAG